MERREGPGYRYGTDDRDHQPPRCVLQLTLSGTCQVAGPDGTIHDVPAGHALAFVQPRERFQVSKTREDLTLFYVGFAGTAMEALLLDIRGRPPVFPLSPDSAPVRHLMHWLPPSPGWRSQGVGAQEGADLIWELLCLCAQSWRGPVPAGERIAVEAMDRMLAALDTCTVEQVATDMGRSRMHLSRCFHETLHCSPGHWLREQRLKLARNLIEHGRSDLEHIARRCGYGSASSLIAAFKQRYHITPGQWDAMKAHLPGDAGPPADLPH
jgi:AraC-like DNA-binding protein